MTTDVLAKLRDQIAIARSTSTFVVLTPDEAQAVFDEADYKRDTSEPQYASPAVRVTLYPYSDDSKPGIHGDILSHPTAGKWIVLAWLARFITIDEARRESAIPPPHEGDDEHA